MGIQIDLDKCTGCGNCQPVCPFDLIEIVDDKADIKEGCNLCGACRDACGFEAVIIEVVAEVAEASDQHHDIWVFAEQRDGRLKNVDYELLSRGRELAAAPDWPSRASACAMSRLSISLAARYPPRVRFLTSRASPAAP